MKIKLTKILWTYITILLGYFLSENFLIVYTELAATQSLVIVVHNSGSSVAAWVLLHIIFTTVDHRWLLEFFSISSSLWDQAVRAAAILGTAGCRGSKEWVAKHMMTFQVSFYLSKILQPNQLTWPNLTSRRRKTTHPIERSTLSNCPSE